MSEFKTLSFAKIHFEQALDEFFKREINRADDLDGSYGRMLRVMHGHVMAGGKRMRPYLALLAYQMYGGQDLAKVTPVGIAWELLHSAMLVHDDIIDRDQIRHGQPTIDRQYEDIYAPYEHADTGHFASMSALMAGDLLISLAHQVIIDSDLSLEEKVQISGFINQAMFTVIGGELMDTETALLPTDQTDPLKIARYKTAGYSVELPMLSGAWLAGAPETERNKLQRICRDIGIAYQLTDDLLGTFGGDSETGKPTDSDIQERKHTTLAQQALARADKGQRERLVRVFRSAEPLDEAEVAEVRSIFVESGAKDAVNEQAQKLSDSAHAGVYRLKISDDAAASFSELITVLAKRNA